MGSIVSINERDLNGFRFRSRLTAPTFYGVVKEMTLLDDIGWGDTNVSFVSSGQYEWVDKRNTIRMNPSMSWIQVDDSREERMDGK